MEKRGIVFTDFLDTIANRSIKHKNSAGKEELRKVQTFLNDYLNENNYMFILSVLDHTSLDDFLILFNEVAKGVDESKIKKLSFHITGFSDTYKLITTHRLPDVEITVNHYNCNKKIVTDSLISKFSIGKQDKIIAAGDSIQDINMLLKAHDMGGTSYYVDKHYLPTSDKTSIDNIIRRIASHSCLKENFDPVYDSLMHQYKTGQITKEELQIKYATCEIADICDCFVSNAGAIALQENLEKKLVLVRTTDDVINSIKK